MKNQKNAYYVISVAAEMAGIHPQTLRIYERRGLIEPYRTPGGTRRYSQQDIERVGVINELTNQGLNLEGVRQVLGLMTEVERLREELDQLRQSLNQRLREAERAIDQVHRSYKRELVLRSDITPSPQSRRS